MKVNSLSGSLNYSNYVREKQDGQSGSSHHQDNHSHQEKKENPENPSQESFDQALSSAESSLQVSEQVGQAIENFQADTQTQANGLSASLEGKGPGLKVVLKDGSGTIVRRLSGEEFLKLREGISKDSKIRGKILDQKL